MDDAGTEPAADDVGADVADDGANDGRQDQWHRGQHTRAGQPADHQHQRGGRDEDAEQHQGLAEGEQADDQRRPGLMGFDEAKQ
ncbi:hypothetical protein Q3H58_004751 [Pseudomonas psychrotolerans]|nr:hypothetical protein [Pseudomonas psychrotolerans]